MTQKWEYVGKWSCVELFGLWELFLATMHKMVVRSKFWYNSKNTEKMFVLDTYHSEIRI